MSKSFRIYFWPFLLLLAGLLVFALWADELTRMVTDTEALRTWVGDLGAWGPVAVVALGVIQVLVAPVPGYPIVFVSGILFGGWWGAIYANIGLLIAGMTAAFLARTFGRPLAKHFVSQSHLTRIEQLLNSDSAWLWFLILFLPTGDLPYYAAGLSRIPLRRYFLSLFAARVPFTFVLTHAAAHATTLSGTQLLPFIIPVALLALLVYWQQERIMDRIFALLRHLAKKPEQQYRA